MDKNDLEVPVPYLRDFCVRPEEAERVAKGVQSAGNRVRALAADRLTFEDEPAAFGRVLERTRLP
jgi:hypothetical protein